MIVTKATDDFLESAKLGNILHFMRELSTVFNVSKLWIAGSPRSITCEIHVGDEIIELSMRDYVDKISKLRITDAHSHQKDSTTTSH